MIKRIKALIASLGAEAVRYLIIGVATTLVNFGLFTLMTKAFGMEATETGVRIANITSISVSIIFAYAANKLFVFRSHCKTAGELLAEAAKFIGARIITLLMEYFGVELIVNVWGADAVIGKLAMQVFVVVTNYFISKLLVFKKER